MEPQGPLYVRGCREGSAEQVMYPSAARPAKFTLERCVLERSAVPPTAPPVRPDDLLYQAAESWDALLVG